MDSIQQSSHMEFEQLHTDNIHNNQLTSQNNEGSDKHFSIAEDICIQNINPYTYPGLNNQKFKKECE